MITRRLLKNQPQSDSVGLPAAGTLKTSDSNHSFPLGVKGQTPVIPSPLQGGGLGRGGGGKNNKTGLHDYARKDEIVFTLLPCTWPYSDPAYFLLRHAARSRSIQ